MASSEPSPDIEDVAPDQPHHPANPKLNFTWLYICIAAIFVISVSVKLMVCIIKRRRAQKRDPDLERQQLEVFQKWWFPWRYKTTQHGAGGGENNSRKNSSPGESSFSQQTVFPQTPDAVRHRESVLDKLVSSHIRKPRPSTDSNARPGSSSSLGSAALMTGALAAPAGGAEPPIQLQPLSARLEGAGMGTGQRDSDHRSLPLPTNPYTNKPFRPAPAADRPDPSARTAAAAAAAADGSSSSSPSTGRSAGRTGTSTPDSDRWPRVPRGSPPSSSAPSSSAPRKTAALAGKERFQHMRRPDDQWSVALREEEARARQRAAEEEGRKRAKEAERREKEAEKMRKREEERVRREEERARKEEERAKARRGRDLVGDAKKRGKVKE